MYQTNRIVTGHNAEGKAVILYADRGKNVTEIQSWPGLFVTELWVTDEMPIDNDGDADRSLRPMRHDPTESGTIFRLVEIPPESRTSFDPDGIFSELGSNNKPSEEDSAKHPTMHKTDSIDYLVVLTGKMSMVMEEGEIEVSQGDCIVQRGTNHAWKNTSDEPCVLAAILIDAQPAP
ncbi:MAG: cupin domain-containing protein [Proteobacteria bacterium]|nr:cupin domain-containing protein [Pseudomonadota bacterium]